MQWWHSLIFSRVRNSESTQHPSAGCIHIPDCRECLAPLGVSAASIPWLHFPSTSTPAAVPHSRLSNFNNLWVVTLP